MSESQEKELVEGILRGEKQAFGRFYHAEKEKLLGFILRRMTHFEDAQELVQDTFLAFLDSLPWYSFRSSLRTFLYSIARHEVADYFRRRYAKRALKLVPLVGEVVDEKLYRSGELSRQIERVYGKLLPRYAEILQLKYEEELSVKEIATKLRLSAKAVESRLFRARAAFQLAFSEVND